MSAVSAIQISGVEHRYGDRTALAGVDLNVQPEAIFGLLGPNGGGKTTLFRLLSTLLPIQRGSIRICDRDVSTEPDAVRRLLGVTFQSPSLDRKLTVIENLRHQGHLYGLRGSDLESRITVALGRFGVADRSRQIVQTLSGGLQRRVEIAKGLLHDPRVLLLDEPSTGLDPGARQEMWGHLEALRRETGVAILVTTHLMDEAERCDALAIIDRGKIVAEGVPHELRSSIGGDCLTIRSREPQSLADKLKSEFGLEVLPLGDLLRIEREQGHLLVGELMERFGSEIQSISLGKPTLEDVFLARTGHRFEGGEA